MRFTLPPVGAWLAGACALRARSFPARVSIACAILTSEGVSRSFARPTPSRTDDEHKLTMLCVYGTFARHMQ